MLLQQAFPARTPTGDGSLPFDGSSDHDGAIGARGSGKAEED